MANLLKLTLLMLLLSASIQANDKSQISITDINGITHKITGTDQGLNIEGLEGKIVFLEFFGHKCPPCLKSIPHLIKLQEKHKDKLAIISIEVQGHNNKQLAEFAKEKGMKHIVVSSEKAGIFIDYIAQRAQWKGSIPFLVVLDAKGSVQLVQAGMIPESSLEEIIKQLSPKDKPTLSIEVS